MLINLSEILSVANNKETFEAKLDMDYVVFCGNSYEIQNEIPVSLTISSPEKKQILIEGKGDIHVAMVCDRCLEQVEQTFHLEFTRSLIFNKGMFQDKIDTDDEVSYIEDCNLDVDKLIQNELISMLPMKILCKEDCKGICSVCGGNRNITPCDCNPKIPDPRMAVFSDIFNQFKEV